MLNLLISTLIWTGPKSLKISLIIWRAQIFWKVIKSVKRMSYHNLVKRNFVRNQTSRSINRNLILLNSLFAKMLLEFSKVKKPNVGHKKKQLRFKTHYLKSFLKLLCTWKKNISKKISKMCLMLIVSFLESSFIFIWLMVTIKPKSPF